MQEMSTGIIAKGMDWLELFHHTGIYIMPNTFGPKTYYNYYKFKSIKSRTIVQTNILLCAAILKVQLKICKKKDWM